MAVEVKVPAVGESVQEAMIHKWHKASGDFVEMDDVLLEVETDKATVEVTAEAEGVLETLKNEGDTVEVGELIARIDTDAKRPAGGQKSSPVESKPAATGGSQAVTSAMNGGPPVPPPPPTSANSAAAGGHGSSLSPAVRRLVEENRLDPSAIQATGKGGRLTKSDVLDHMNRKQAPASQPVAPSKPTPSPQPEFQLPQPRSASDERVERREPMSMLRRRIAQRLVEAQQTAAMLTTFNEVDMSGILKLRKQYKESFKEKHGIGLGFMSFFLSASVEALKAFPAINGWIENNEIVYHDYYDIGVAVSGDRGLVVPVIRDVDQLSFADIEKSIAYYAQKARSGKISVDDLTGGTFTVSNGGVFGSLMSTPILNPPQSAILGMHKIEERPVAINGQVEVRPMMYLALSYDHRIVDGSEAVRFLVKIKECVEDPHRLLLGV